MFNTILKITCEERLYSMVFYSNCCSSHRHTHTILVRFYFFRSLCLLFIVQIQQCAHNSLAFSFSVEIIPLHLCSFGWFFNVTIHAIIIPIKCELFAKKLILGTHYTCATATRNHWIFPINIRFFHFFRCCCCCCRFVGADVVHQNKTNNWVQTLLGTLRRWIFVRWLLVILFGDFSGDFYSGTDHGSKLQFFQHTFLQDLFQFSAHPVVRPGVKID